MPDIAQLAQFKEWIGRTDIRQDVVTAAPLVALAALLDRDDPPPAAGDAAPPLAHWLYFLPNYRQSEAGPDGHALKGSFMPPVPLPRRMWAGSRLEFFKPLRARARRREVEARDPSRSRAPLPLLGGDLQQPSHPLRPAVRDEGRGLSRPRR